MRTVLTSTILLIACLALASPTRANPVTAVDDLGRPIILAHTPQRIVSLEPSVTEVLYAVGAGGKIVADDLSSDYPAAAKTLPHVNGIAPSREMMLGLKPDIIILFDQTFTRGKADEWQATYGVPVYVAASSTYAGVEEDIRRIGELVGMPASAEKVADKMASVVQKVSRAVAKQARPSVFVVVWDKPLMTAGKGTFIDDLIRLAGGIDIASLHVSGYPTYSPERVVADDPDFVLSGTLGDSVEKQKAGSLSSLSLRAERVGNCFALPDDWTSRPGPRLSLGLLAIAKVLHPNCFSSGNSAHSSR